MAELARITLDDEAATRRLAEDIAAVLRKGDVVTLSGDLGAGKSTLARALIRTLARDPELDVPSPTFTVVQTYALPRIGISHFDLYRLADASELEEIGFTEALDDTAVLIEWPERAGGALPADRLDIRLDSGPGPEARVAVLSGDAAAWAERLERTQALRGFMAAQGWGDAHREFLYGDAHHRVYERLRRGGESRVLMNQPAEKDETRKAQRRSQKLTEDTRSFEGFALALAGYGISVPRVERHDPARGMMILEDFGDTFCVAGDPPAPIPERYLAAAELLGQLHSLDLPAQIPDGQGGIWTVPAWDRTALANEVTVLLDWGVEAYIGRPASAGERADFLALWQPLFAELEAAPKTWCLRDFHSPNLMWLADREGAARVGVLDFQDTILGAPAYDVVSLAQDARVTVPADLETALKAAYVAARRANDAFDETAFVRAYAILAAQRSTRLLGQFVRLKRRDGKPGYIRHIPRLWTYLDRALDDPVTNPLRLWYEAVIPRDRRDPTMA